MVDSESFGFGIRVLAEGTWGFASSYDVSHDAIARAAAQAAEIAKANAPLRRRPVATGADARLQRHLPHRRRHRPVLGADRAEARPAPRGRGRGPGGQGGLLGQCVHPPAERGPVLRVERGEPDPPGGLPDRPRVHGARPSRPAARSSREPTGRNAVCAGYEAVERAKLVENARRVGEQAVEHLKAPSVSPGVKDLVLLPTHLGLTIHESIGHSTELDRAFGYEANYAGTSFLTPDKLGKFRVGLRDRQLLRRPDPAREPLDLRLRRRRRQDAPIPDHQGRHLRRLPDHSRPGPPDRPERVDGLLLRRLVCLGAVSADAQRLAGPIEPGTTTLEDLISGVDDGILIDGRGSYSIDQQRYNFQFGGDAFFAIKGGKLGPMIADVAYQSRTPDFWASCDGIGGQALWENVGLTNDGKGQPGQVNAMSHGCAPARFRKINVLRTA